MLRNAASPLPWACLLDLICPWKTCTSTIRCREAESLAKAIAIAKSGSRERQRPAASTSTSTSPTRGEGRRSKAVDEGGGTTHEKDPPSRQATAIWPMRDALHLGRAAQSAAQDIPKTCRRNKRRRLSTRVPRVGLFGWVCCLGLDGKRQKTPPPPDVNRKQPPQHHEMRWPGGQREGSRRPPTPANMVELTPCRSQGKQGERGAPPPERLLPTCEGSR